MILPKKNTGAKVINDVEIRDELIKSGRVKNYNFYYGSPTGSHLRHIQYSNSTPDLQKLNSTFRPALRDHIRKTQK